MSIAWYLTIKIASFLKIVQEGLEQCYKQFNAKSADEQPASHRTV
jgi:hypothetical protein